MVNQLVGQTVEAADRARAAAASVMDPEIGVLSIEELGILRDVEVGEDGAVVVTITPTYTACPAMDAIRCSVRDVVQEAGFDSVDVRVSWSPSWTTDWISDDARAKLKSAGIAPPLRTSNDAVPRGVRLLPLLTPRPPCPRCGSTDTSEASRFGSTACKALWLCAGCREPFDHMKEH